MSTVCLPAAILVKTVLVDDRSSGSCGCRRGCHQAHPEVASTLHFAATVHAAYFPSHHRVLKMPVLKGPDVIKFLVSTASPRIFLSGTALPFAASEGHPTAPRPEGLGWFPWGSRRPRLPHPRLPSLRQCKVHLNIMKIALTSWSP